MWRLLIVFTLVLLLLLITPVLADAAAGTTETVHVQPLSGDIWMRMLSEWGLPAVAILLGGVGLGLILWKPR